MSLPGLHCRRHQTCGVRGLDEELGGCCYQSMHRVLRSGKWQAQVLMWSLTSSTAHMRYTQPC